MRNERTVRPAAGAEPTCSKLGPHAKKRPLKCLPVVEPTELVVEVSAGAIAVPDELAESRRLPAMSRSGEVVVGVEGKRTDSGIGSEQHLERGTRMDLPGCRSKWTGQ